ncbi:uncharacterized [Tachysurus ichikawai]
MFICMLEQIFGTNRHNICKHLYVNAFRQRVLRGKTLTHNVDNKDSVSSSPSGALSQQGASCLLKAEQEN